MLVAAVAAGCGAGERAPRQASPRLPSNVAHSLALESDALAASLERGDACSAVRRAAALRQSVHRAIDDGRIPEAFRRELLHAVDALSAEVPACIPPSDNDRGESGGHDRGKHKGRDKGKGGEKD